MTKKKDDSAGVDRDSEVRTDPPAPRAARFGEGPEGRPARRERAEADSHEPNAFERTGRFIRDTRAELKRVSWPSAIEVRNTTIITIIAVIFFAVYLWLVDKGFTLLITQIRNLVNWLLGAA